MKNILFVASFRITPSSGGVQRVTETLAHEFLINGINVHYLALSKGEEEIINGIKQFYLPFEGELNKYENTVFFNQLLKKSEINIIINQVGFNTDVIQFINDNKNNDTKVISVHHNCVKCLNDQYNNIYNSTLKSKGLLWLFDNKVGWYFLKKIHKKRFGNTIKRTFLLSDQIVLLSEKFIPDLSFYYPDFEKRKVVGIPNPNPFSQNFLNPEIKKENILLYVGRVEKTQKRVDKLIKIWELISEQFEDWSLHVVGTGSMKNELENIIKLKKINQIVYHGFKDPVPFYEKAKILCLTSDFEGYGMVLVEAQNYGVVPFSFDCFSSINDIIENEESGIIIDNFDLKVYIEKLENLMKDEERLIEMSKKAQNHSRIFDAENIVKSWNNLFEKLKLE